MTDELVNARIGTQIDAMRAENDKWRRAVAELSERPTKEAYAVLQAECGWLWRLLGSLWEDGAFTFDGGTVANIHGDPQQSQMGRLWDDRTYTLGDGTVVHVSAAVNTHDDPQQSQQAVYKAIYEVAAKVQADIVAALDLNAGAEVGARDFVRQVILPVRREDEAALRVMLQQSYLRILATKDDGGDMVEYLIGGDVLLPVPADDIPVCLPWVKHETVMRRSKPE